MDIPHGGSWDLTPMHETGRLRGRRWTMVEMGRSACPLLSGLRSLSMSGCQFCRVRFVSCAGGIKIQAVISDEPNFLLYHEGKSQRKQHLISSPIIWSFIRRAKGLSYEYSACDYWSRIFSDIFSTAANELTYAFSFATSKFLLQSEYEMVLSCPLFWSWDKRVIFISQLHDLLKSTNDYSYLDFLYPYKEWFSKVDKNVLKHLQLPPSLGYPVRYFNRSASSFIKCRRNAMLHLAEIIAAERVAGRTCVLGSSIGNVEKYFDEIDDLFIHNVYMRILGTRLQVFF